MCNDNLLKNLMDTTKETFSTKEISDNYKQKLVYQLLNYIKANNEKRFLNDFLRAINRKDDKFKQLADKVCQTEAPFEKWAYAIVCGILSSNSS